MSNISSLRSRLDQLKGKKAHIEQSLQEAKEKLKTQMRGIKRHELALDTIRMAALATQQQLQYHISDVVSSALDTVFEDPYEMVVEFVQRRNKTECDLAFKKGDLLLDPLSASGCGVVDIASFALRIASWSMQRNRTRNVIILDEPFKHLSTNLMPQAGELLKRVCDDMNLQIIMVTHSEELVDSADKIFRVKQINRISRTK